ncbi:hypothetical protein MPRS_03340 [Mycobacterium paraseoulense]|nr:hypothetical protein MPRS_03340 [Mycobacterium paraseoulense]
MAVNAHGLRSSQPLWLAISIGKHRFGQPFRISDIHFRLIGAGVTGGALSWLVNAISGRVGPPDLALIDSPRFAACRGRLPIKS